MDTRLQEALEFSNYKNTFNIQRKTLQEKADAQLTYGCNGGLFKIDHSLITFVQMLIDQDRIKNVVILDSNQNPILIENMEDFKDELFDRYFSVVNEFYAKVSDLKKTRSVEKLLDL